MTKEFYEYLFRLRASGFIHNTEENTREMFLAADPIRAKPSEGFTVPDAGVISYEGLKGEVGSLSETDLHNYRNAIICTATTCLLISSDHHTDAEAAHGLADYYVNKADTIRSARDFQEMSMAMFRDFQELYQTTNIPRYGRMIDRAIDYIIQNLYSNLKASDVASYMKMNPSYLSDQIKEATGYTLYAYILRLKLAEASKLLTMTDRSLSEISSALGFCAQSHFTKAFKKMYGMPPSEFRKKDPVRTHVS